MACVRRRVLVTLAARPKRVSQEPTEMTREGFPYLFSVAAILDQAAKSTISRKPAPPPFVSESGSLGVSARSFRK